MQKRAPLAVIWCRWASILAATVLLTHAEPVAADSPHAEVPTIRIVPRRPPASLSIPTLDFQQFYRFGARAPEPSAELLALAGKKVTLVGFMVLLDTPVLGGFYLSPYPAACDESGAGRGDVPPTSVLVLPKVAQGKQVAFVPGALEVTGILEVGNKETSGETWTIRLIVEDPRHLRFARTKSTLSLPRNSAREAQRGKK